MAAVFPLDTTKPWVFNGVTYEYDATEDRWFVVSTTATDSVIEGITDNRSQIDVLDTIIDQEIDNRTALLNAAANKNNEQDSSIAALEGRVDALGAVVGALEFKGRYKYVLEKSVDACTAAYAECLLQAGGDVPSMSECNRLKDACEAAVGDPYADGVFTSKGTTNVIEDVEELVFTGTDLDGQVFDWLNLCEVDDYIELVELNNSDNALYQVIEEPKVFSTERSIRVKYLKQGGRGDGNFNLQEEYDVRIIKASQGLDILEADNRYVARPYSVIFSDTPPTTGQALDGVLQNGEQWYDTKDLELFIWNNNSWTSAAKPPSQDVLLTSVVNDVDNLLGLQAEQAQRFNSLVSDLAFENNIYYSDGPPVGDINGTLRDGDLWVDSDDLTIKFYSQGQWINPDRQVGGDYLEKSGGTMTGTIRSHTGGGGTTALEIKSVQDNKVVYKKWCPGGTGTQIKNVARWGTEHWFQVYDNTDANPVTTCKFGYQEFQLTSKPNVFYKGTDAHDFTGRAFFRQANNDLKIDVGPSNVDIYLKARFKDGFVVKATGQAISGDNVLFAGGDYVGYYGRITADADITTKAYVDSRTQDATVSQKGIAKLGKVAKGTTVPSLEQGQLFYNTATKALLIKA